MPNNYKNSLGYIALQLKAQDEGRKAEAAIREQEFERENAARQEAMNVKTIGQTFDNFNQSENRKLQLAAMMQKAEADRASREMLAGQRDETTRRGQDLTNEDRDALRAQTGANQDRNFQLNFDKFGYQREHDQVEDAQRAYGLFSGRLGAVNQPNPVTGRKPYELGIETLAPPPGLNDFFTPQAGAAPQTSGAMPGVQPAPPPPPGEVDLTKKQHEANLEEIGADAEDLKDLDNAIAAMKDPKQANPSDFGNTGGRFSFFGMTPNTVGDIVNPEGAARRSAIKQKIEIPINKMARKYGAALTNTEIGRVLGEAGIQAAIDGRLDVTATDLPVLLQAYEATRARLGEKAQRTATELQTGRRKLPGADPGVRREPPARSIPVPLGAQNTPSDASSLVPKDPDSYMEMLMRDGHMSEEEAYKATKKQFGME